ncbi:PIR Superfamily Protein [Plasmodium ovale wallikeri]|uniref:PIR Superfamily Protein n=1 Tax=Plasmodium ovale wallikeri TaxID=864142 RepID=A0A1A8YGL2_PLAOA|nr:PIR Superfamily Protein [Plasmodium ovale wallikeri]SBT58249.1 PIR Superfamily Protein [Plasmodium ovale wallikeri]
MSKTCSGPSDLNGLERCSYSSCSNGCYCEELNEISKFSSNIDDINSYVGHIQGIDDPFLRHISLYVVQNYLKIHGKYSYGNSSVYRSEVCQQYNRWLGKWRHLFTYGGNCKRNENLWDIHIKPLYNLLESSSSNNYNVRCTIKPHVFQNNLLDKIAPPDKCNVTVVEDTQLTSYILPSSCPNSDTHYEKPKSLCDCSTCDNAVTEKYVDTESPCSKPYDIAISTGFTLTGTTIILFLLYKFTPLVSWLHNQRSKNKKGRQHYFDESADDLLEIYPDIKNSHTEKRRNDIFYHSMRN